MSRDNVALENLIEQLFTPDQLQSLLGREDWAAPLLRALPSTYIRQEYFYRLVYEVDQHGLDAELRELLIRERKHREAEIDMAFSARSSARPALAPLARPHTPSRLSRIGLVLTVAVAILFFLALTYLIGGDLP